MNLIRLSAFALAVVVSAGAGSAIAQEKEQAMDTIHFLIPGGAGGGWGGICNAFAAAAGRGSILGGMLEDNFARSVQLYDGASFMWERPMTMILLIIAAVLVLLPGL